MPSKVELEIKHPPTLQRVRVHRANPTRVLMMQAVFIALHAACGQWCFQSSGQPYQVALDKVKQRNREYFQNGTKDEDKAFEEPLPSEWAPNEWAAAALFFSISFHVFFYMLGHWRVGFKAWSSFSPADRVTDGCYFELVPLQHRGTAALVKAKRAAASGRLTVEYQRQRIEFWGEEDSEAELDGTADDCPGELRLMECPVQNPLPEYLAARGLSEDDVADLRERFGPNLLKVQTPSFFKCYREQLATPLVVFQFFIALLWAADDFLGYTLTQIVMILVFESTSVFQRINMLKTLNSMGTQPFQVKVYRDSAWSSVSTADLLPGDLLQLVVEQDDEPPPASGQAGVNAPANAASSGPSTDIVPCDCVILRGDCVANEATITGESVPQMKDALPEEDRALDSSGTDRCHALFSGSRLLRAGGGRGAACAKALGDNGEKNGEEDAADAIAALGELPETPDGGCLCFVTRTGFYSSQGELLQVIEFSRAKVTGDSKEIMVALLILTCFALVSAGYVLNRGLKEGERTPHELIVKCVIIISSVVPRGLPMQMSMAVNTALMSLMKTGVYCTEPFRVPVTGKVTHCLFDKTGTLTTDTLVPAGVVNVALADDGNGELVTLSTVDWRVQEVRRASPRAAVVLAACHSLVTEGRGEKLTGDPVEVAALQGVGWRYDIADGTARPGNWAELDRKVEALKAEVEKLQGAMDAPSVKRREEQGKALDAAEAAAAAEKSRAAKAPTESVRILHRFHFASRLQRMSVIAELEDRGNGTADAPGDGAYVLVKGSPEALKPLLTEGSAPSWFDSAYVEMAEQGRRVLALAARKLPENFSRDEADLKKLTREEMETDLRFVGFIAFECQIRADSKLVISALSDSDHSVAMITGDAALTALHVAKECGFCLEGKETLQLKIQPDGAAKWVVAAGPLRGQPAPEEAVAKLAESYSLAVTEDALEAADEAIWNDIDHIAIFARMTPNGKAKVIRSIQSRGGFVLMCGDGGNDAGALKQADAGLALLAGHGQVNTADKVSIAMAEVAAAPGGGVLVTTQEKGAEMGAEDALNARQQELAQRTKDVQKLRQQHLKQRQKELQVLQQKWLEEEVEARAQRGETGLMAQGAAVKTVLTRFTGELRKEMREFDMKHGNVFDGEVGAETKDADADENDEDDPMKGGPRKMELARPGDASVAAPFTSRQPSVKGCVDLIRQGRCTLLSALQQQQVMMMNAIINAFVLSVISLEGSRRSERQLLASDWLLTTASIAFSYATPVDKMHKIRPLRSLFHPAIFVSMLGQAAIHLGCLYFAVQMCREVMEDESAARQAGWEGPSLTDIKAFWKKQRLIRRGIIEKEGAEEEDWYQQMMEMWFMPFLPNLMNTVIFLVETAQTVAVLTVNYKGQPWMKGVLENRALFFSLFLCGGSLIAAAWEFSPDINVMLHLSPFPNNAFRWKVIGLVGVTLFGTFAWDRFCIALFAREHFSAMLSAVKKTTFQGDIVPMLKCFVKVVMGFTALAIVGGLGQPPTVVAELVTE